MDSKTKQEISWVIDQYKKLLRESKSEKVQMYYSGALEAIARIKKILTTNQV